MSGELQPGLAAWAGGLGWRLGLAAGLAAGPAAGMEPR